MGRPPFDSSKHKLCIICEGLEEAVYIQHLNDKKVWNEKYDITVVNAKGAGTIPARYDYQLKSDSYELVLVFCDTDKAPYREYQNVMDKINDMHTGKNATKQVVIFANPCTMQIVLSHFGDVNLATQAKKTNAPIIEQLTGVKDYKASEDQIKEICGKINRENYNAMKERIKNMNKPDNVSGSTNFIDFIECFESDDPSWIQEKRKALSNGQEESDSSC